jgi:hypothetical protein
MKQHLLLLFITLSNCGFSQPEMTKIEWIPYFDQYKGSGGMTFKGKIYDSHIIAVTERIDVYDEANHQKLYDTTLAHIQLKDFKKPKHMDFFGFFKDDDEAFILTRCKAARKGEMDVYIIPLDETKNILKSLQAEEADEGFDINAIYDLRGNELKTDRFIALLEARYLGNGEYSGIETSLLVLDVINDKLVLEDHVEKGSEYADFWNGRFFLTGTHSAYSYEGLLHIDDCESMKEFELNMKTHFNTEMTPRLVAFQKSQIGFIAVIDESKKPDAFDGSKDFTGQIHRLILNGDLEIQKDKTVSWNLMENDYGIKKISHDIHINERGDVFIMSHGNQLYGMDVFGISHSGEIWLKSIPFNHGRALMYSEHAKDGTGIQAQVFGPHLYLAYMDNIKNLATIDHNSYRRPEKELDTHTFREVENRIITILRLDGLGTVEIFKVIDEANSDVKLSNLNIAEGTIHLHGSKGLRHQSALLKF